MSNNKTTVHLNGCLAGIHNVKHYMAVYYFCLIDHLSHFNKYVSGRLIQITDKRQINDCLPSRITQLFLAPIAIVGPTLRGG